MTAIARTKPTIITTPKGERLAVIPEADFRALAEAAEDLADIRAYDRAKKRLAQGKDELVPIEMYDRIAAGENRVRVWREHRGLKLNALAARAGIKPPFLSQIETGRRTASLATVKALARALGVGVDDLVG
jgi:ribosome-binding protein aMBF1 (putative translation factor)